MPIADLGDRSLHYVRRGEGLPLLLIQGMAGHHLMWGEALLSDLERDFDVVAFNHRGIGDSSRAEPPYEITDLADDAAALMTALGWADANVFGVSLGGMVAQQVAIRHPERVRTLTLGCTYAGKGGTLGSPGLSRIARARATGDVRETMRASYEVNLSPALRVDESWFARFADAALAERVPGQVIMMQQQAALRHDAVADLAGIDVPTLVVHGTADEVVTFANAAHVAGAIPGARLEVMPDVGHLFWWERPELTAKLLREHAR
ncbi:alpha/beta fold hydrolase [Actinokineospora fastidiosa]|uniref:Alpha/beta hydrolase fold protein n=1 Tax=Actinokineospora fastidiosa TaxID=1816 RepID=A0A918LJZ4_9PSEU|nr:alpha/beta fold hydrolase [Actinokineospora fastidiosa]GGS59322.1 alpha/beta hydrolase fold protein [Actinokineospora fastidiosa]